MKRTPLKRGNYVLKGSGGLKRSSLKSGGGFTSKKKPVKRKSEKQKQEDIEYEKTKEAVWKRDGGLCRGCRTSERLSFSHYIPRSHRKDLVTEVDNVALHCMSFGGIKGCHTKHEDQEWDQMLDGQIIIATMKRLDLQYFRRITL